MKSLRTTEHLPFVVDWNYMVPTLTHPDSCPTTQSFPSFLPSRLLLVPKYPIPTSPALFSLSSLTYRKKNPGGAIEWRQCAGGALSRPTLQAWLPVQRTLTFHLPCGTPAWWVLAEALHGWSESPIQSEKRERKRKKYLSTIKLRYSPSVTTNTKFVEKRQFGFQDRLPTALQGSVAASNACFYPIENMDQLLNLNISFYTIT